MVLPLNNNLRGSSFISGCSLPNHHNNFSLAGHRKDRGELVRQPTNLHLAENITAGPFFIPACK
jgi:hypothetical protein